MNDIASILLSFVLPLIFLIFILRLIQRSDGWIEMPEHLFWEFVAKHTPAPVFVVPRGLVLKRSCYVFAY